ncbi:MAG: cupin domain-containing protein [Alistipes sp.]|nr:cupin domain-containing protein [Alistipes sp.]
MKRFLATFVAAVLLPCATVKAQTMKERTTDFEQIFPQGGKLPEQFSQYFIGQAYLAPVSRSAELGTNISNVTFEPGCRNNWHSHTGGQLLICTAGRGLYQEKGSPARELRPGDVVEIAPGAVHWHGAAPDSWFSHLAVECNPASNVDTWLEPVDDGQYAAAAASALRAGSSDTPHGM